MLFSNIELANNSYKKSESVEYFNAPVLIISEMQNINNDIYNITKKTMMLESKAIKENNSTLLTLTIQDFFSKIVEILIRMRDNLIACWNKFKTYVKNLKVSNLKYLKRYEHLLIQKDMSGFKYPCFKYTIGNNVPNISIKDYFLKDLNIENIESLTKYDLEKIEMQSDYFEDELRAKILNRKGFINKKEFVNQLYLEFRGGSQNKSFIKLETGKEKTDFINVIRSFDDDLIHLDATKKDLIDFYNRVIDYFNNFNKIIEREGDGVVRIRSNNSHNLKEIPVISDKYELLSTYGEIKSKMCKSAISIYNLAFSMKLDAFKNRNNDYKEILIHALNYNSDEVYTNAILRDEI